VQYSTIDDFEKKWRSMGFSKALSPKFFRISNICGSPPSG
jgi:hypothetical protein